MPQEVMTSMPQREASPVASKLPNLIIAGVHRAGTTAMYSYPARHPEICPSYLTHGYQSLPEWLE